MCAVANTWSYYREQISKPEDLLWSIALSLCMYFTEQNDWKKHGQKVLSKFVFFRLEFRSLLEEKKVPITTPWSQVYFYFGFLNQNNKQRIFFKIHKGTLYCPYTATAGRTDWTATLTLSPELYLSSLSGTYCILAYNMKATYHSSPKKIRYDLVK